MCVCVCVCEAKLKKIQNLMKIDVEHFGYNNLLRDFKFTKNVVKIAMDVC